MRRPEALSCKVLLGLTCPVEEGERLLVDEAVRTDDLLVRAWRSAVYRAHAPSRFLDQRHERREVPECEPGVDRDVQRALRHEHALPEVAQAPRVPDERLEAGEVASV